MSDLQSSDPRGRAMTYTNPDALVATEWLAAHLDDPSVRIVDGTSYLPNVPRDARKEYEEKHIPGAVFVDIDEVSDHSSPLPHMLPRPEAFAAKAGALGIAGDQKIVVYDSHGVRTAPRVWWTFRAFGHEDIAILDGGLPKWEAEGRPVASGAESPASEEYAASFQPGLVRDLRQMLANQKSREAQVIDARPAGRFHGTDPEPREGLPSGHIPGSVSMPVEMLVDDRSGTVLPADQIEANFDALGIDADKPVITSCGSGVAACVVSLGQYLLGRGNAPVYDGSWTEWAGRPDAEIETT
jgi:thiosulfate/3-mercaptopyruvate sulfurtransferase